jgi:hypothetical protein
MMLFPHNTHSIDIGGKILVWSCLAATIKPQSPRVVELHGQCLVVKEISKSGFILGACKEINGGFW